MPLIVYNKETGAIVQSITYAQPGLEHMKKVHDEMGDGTLITDAAEYIDVLSSYVKDGEMRERPLVTVTSQDKKLKANGKDKLELTFEPASRIEIVFDGLNVFTQDNVSKLPVSVNAPGSYEVKVIPPFPYLGMDFTVEAE